MGVGLERSAYLDLLGRWRWTLLLAAWVAGLVSYVAISQVPPTYEARARVLVGAVVVDVDTVRAVEGLIQTYSELATTEPMLRTVIDDLGLNMTPEELSKALTVTANSTTRILSIRATDHDPAQAARMANTVADQIIQLTNQGISRPEGQLTLVDPAVVPSEPAAPNVPLVVLMTAAAGLLAAGLLAVAVEYLNHTVRGLSELVELTGVPALGEININHGYHATQVQPLVVEAQPESDTALGYQLLARRLPIDHHDENRIHSLLIVGSQVGDLAGEFAANLAAVIARTGRSVTLIDADDLEGHVSSMFISGGRLGLRELLGMTPEAVSTSDVLDSVTVRRVPNIELIPIGLNPSQTVREDSAAAILESTSRRRDLVIISGAPIHRSASSLMWARLTDGAVLVCRADSTRIENLEYAADSLRSVEAAVLGNVLLVRHGSRARRRHTAKPPSATLRQADVSPRFRAPGSAPNSGAASDRRDKSPG